MALADVIKTALDQIQSISKTETVFGEPIQAGEVLLIPVSRVSIGFAAGGGDGGKVEKTVSGAGAGGGVNITPVAFISVSGEKVQVHSISPSETLSLGQLMSAAPELFGKISKYFKKKDEMTPEEK
ncbi:MAG TPA: spore germination protein GerW family protein [Chitinispirillaceae bacterium]|nr:spore germination protein GerW family protein [Chitinispirillaceae bacterium]